MPRKVCIITGTRADYGLVYWLLKEIQNDPELTLQIIVTGAHLSPEFGLTYNVLLQDGFPIDAKVEMLLSSDSGVGVAKSMGLGIIGIAEVIDRLDPDVMVVTGDRFEMLAAAEAAMLKRLPIVHLYGGEITEGAVDDSIRHCLTKLSHYHFVAAEPYRQRVIQLGEQPDRVFNVGAPALDYIIRTPLLSKQQLEQELDFTFGELCFLVTYHPVTLSQSTSQEEMHSLFEALDEFPEAKIIFTMPNADTDGRIIFQMIGQYIKKQPGRAKAFTSLGQLKYLSAMKWSTVVIGNSSSGIMEAPLLKTPTVNIGFRQQGRLRADSIIDCQETPEDIKNAIHKSLSVEFQSIVQQTVSLYGIGNASHHIKEHLKQIELDKAIFKRFYDIDTNKKEGFQS